MKKTMFITSVIMVVVLAIALTTSSLAWFSAGGATQVTVNNFTVTAATAELATGLEIAVASRTENTYSAGDWKSTAISLSNGTNALPMVPYKADAFTVSETKVNIQELYNAISGNMKTNKVALIDSVSKFNGTPESATPYSATFALRNQGQTNLPIGNSQTDKITVTVTQVANHDDGNGGVEETGAEANLWVAIFEIPVDATGAKTSDAPTLVALSKAYGETAKMAYATGTQLDNQALTAEVPEWGIAQFDISDVLLEAGSYNDAAVWSAGKAHYFEVYAWYDGKTLTNGNDYTLVQVGITIGH